jgi:hypothetical protein
MGIRADGGIGTFHGFVAFMFSSFNSSFSAYHESDFLIKIESYLGYRIMHKAYH